MRYAPVLLLALCCGCSSRVSVDDWVKVENGMGIDEVKLILGEPLSTEQFDSELSGNTYLCWDYLIKGESWSVGFQRAGLTDRWFVVDKCKTPSLDEI